MILIAGMRSATSARDGRFIALTIRGSSPMVEEMLEAARTCRRAPFTTTHPNNRKQATLIFTTPPCGPPQIRAFPPASRASAYMRDEAARVEVAIGDRAAFLGLRFEHAAASQPAR